MPIEAGAPGPAPRRAGYAILGAVLLGIAGIGAGVVATLPGGPAKPPMSVVGGPFRLQASTGGTLDSASLAGRPFLVFFGFTRCPDICPTTLADISNLIDELRGQGGDIRALYVTVDPERDTQDVLRAYMTAFSDGVTGLTGTPAEIAAVARAYRVVVRKVPLAGGGYTLDHTLMVYLMDRDGGFVGPLDLAAGHTLALRQIRAVL